jgi:hypothetical protein
VTYSGNSVDLWSALDTGASITTLAGLLGFVAACIFLAYLGKTRAETKRLELLSPEARATMLDSDLSRYKIKLTNLPADQKYDLVRREMRLKFQRQLGLSGLSAAVFLVSLAMLAFAPHPKSSGRQVTPADKRVVGYMQEIEILRGDFEAQNKDWQSLVRQQGMRLADLIGQIDEHQLNPSRKIVQHEYKGWALLMVARTFTEPGEEQRKKQVDYANRAIGEFDLALSSMEDEVIRRFKTGDEDAAKDYEWITTEGEDLYRTQYLKAVGIAVVARAGGPRTKEEVDATLAKISPAYLEEHPASNNPDLRWVLSR